MAGVNLTIDVNDIFDQGMTDKNEMMYIVNITSSFEI